MIKNEPKPEIAFVNGPVVPLKPEPNLNRPTPSIEVTIGVIQPGDRVPTPRNFRLDSDAPKNSAGGCSARIIPYEHGHGIAANLFSSYGPAISNGQLADYQHGLQACQRLARRDHALTEKRGYAADAADNMGRWLEACGVSVVYFRPDADYLRENAWLNEGEWQNERIGDFVNRVRRCLFIGPAAKCDKCREADTIPHSHYCAACLEQERVARLQIEAEEAA